MKYLFAIFVNVGSTREVCYLVHKQKAYHGKPGRSTLHDAPMWVPLAVPMKPLPHQPLMIHPVMSSLAIKS